MIVKNNFEPMHFFLLPLTTLATRCVDVPGEGELVSAGFGFLQQLQTHIHHVDQEGEGGVNVPTQHRLTGRHTDGRSDRTQPKAALKGLVD